MKFLLPATILFTVYSIQTNAQGNTFEWKVVEPHLNDVRTNVPYGLANQRCHSSLAYYHRNRGISLAFDQSQAPTNIRFEKPGNRSEPINYEDRFAIHVQGGGYIHYEHVPWGINLTYSSTPVYEWKFRNNSFGHQEQNNVSSSDILSLYNTQNDGFLVYGERDYGPPLTWGNQGAESSLIPNTQNNKAQAHLFVRSGPFERPSPNGVCAGRISWTFIPINVTGADGRDRTFTIDKYYEAFEVNTGLREWWGFFHEPIHDLKTGRWKIIVQSSGGNTECEVDLRKGNNHIGFEQNNHVFKKEYQFFEDLPPIHANPIKQEKKLNQSN
jgi:hypothetical protein